MAFYFMSKSHSSFVAGIQGVRAGLDLQPWPSLVWVCALASPRHHLRVGVPIAATLFAAIAHRRSASSSSSFSISLPLSPKASVCTLRTHEDKRNVRFLLVRATVAVGKRCPACLKEFDLQSHSYLPCSIDGRRRSVCLIESKEVHTPETVWLWR